MNQVPALAICQHVRARNGNDATGAEHSPAACLNLVYCAAQSSKLDGVVGGVPTCRSAIAELLALV